MGSTDVLNPQVHDFYQSSKLIIPQGVVVIMILFSMVIS